MPGIGAQGGDWQTVKSCLSKNNKGVWVPVSRGVTYVKETVISRDDYILKVKENLAKIIQQKKDVI